jgi:hypothetical protein
MKKLLGCLALAGVVGGVARAASDDRWIHIRVDDADGAKGRVDIQVPVSLVSSLLPALNRSHGHGTIQLGDDSSMDLAELRDYWKAVRGAKDGEYVTVRDRDSDVRVSKRGGYFLLNVDDRGGKSRVRMKVPLPLVDAILDGGDEINLDALGGALAKAPEGELLTVDDDDSHVRIWIDDAVAPPREDER